MSRNIFSHSQSGTCLLYLIIVFSFISIHLHIDACANDDGKTSSQERIRADRIYAQGTDAFDNGDLVEAIVLWEKAVTEYFAYKETEKQIDVLLRLAGSYQHIGHYAKSLEKLGSAQVISKTINDQNRLAAIWEGFGQYYYLTGEFSKSDDYFVRGLSLTRGTGNAELTAEILNNYGNLLAVQHRFPEAVAAYAECLDQARKANRLDISIRGKINMARLYIDRSKLPEAETLLEDALRKIMEIRDTHNKVYDLIAIGRLLGRIYITANAPDTAVLTNAYSALKSAEVTAGKLTNRRASSYALGYLGAFYEQARRNEDALLLTHRAILAAQESNTVESLYRWYWQKGRLLRKQKSVDEAINAYRQALKSLSAIRQDVSADCGNRTKISFRETVGPVYFELADILLQRSALQKDASAAKNDLMEARNTIEQLKGAELQDYFRDDCVVALRTRTKNLDQIIQQSAVVYFILLSDRIELLVSMPSGLKQFTVPVAIRSLNDEVNILRGKLERLSDTYLQNAQTLYDWLIRPLAGVLLDERIDTLIFVPDGMLRTIPMGILHDGESFLISKYTLVTTPGITLTDPQPISRKIPKLLLGGLAESVQGFPALPGVTGELQSIQKLYDSVIFQDKEFNYANIEKTMKSTPYTIVHIASHGQFDSDPSKTFLLTYDEKLSIDQLEKLMRLGRYREQPVELLTLSACQTAVGDDRAALGLAGISVKAGARSALASLWSVNDEATSQLMTEFYRQLRIPSNSKAKALREAQQKMITDARFNHPAYWAPFILIGNWL
jgi:CHAT domain-containing protein